METIISDEAGFQLVAISGTVTHSGLLATLVDVMKRDLYHQTNDIWWFRESESTVSISRLQQVTDTILALYPKSATRTKTALVTSDGVSEGMAAVWVSLSTTLPYEVKTFRSLGEARKWIIE